MSHDWCSQSTHHACCMAAAPASPHAPAACCSRGTDLQFARQLKHASSGCDDEASMHPALLHLDRSDEGAAGSLMGHRSATWGAYHISLLYLVAQGQQRHEDVFVLVPCSCQVLDQGDAARGRLPHHRSINRGKLGDHPEMTNPHLLLALGSMWIRANDAGSITLPGSLNSGTALGTSTDSTISLHVSPGVLQSLYRKTQQSRGPTTSNHLSRWDTTTSVGQPSYTLSPGHSHAL